MSDFWTDLQAWTQAQVDALLRDSARKRKKNIASDINRLLRDRIAKRLEAKLGKAIGSEFRRTGGRQQAPFVPGPLTILDTGWHTRESGVSWIATWEALAAYYGSGGFSTVCNRIEPPDLDTDRRHISLFGDDHITEAITSPTMYSGLTRLFMQSLLGANRSYAAEFNLWLSGYGWSTDPGKLGLIRSPAGVYWLVQADPTVGVQAAQLAIPEEYQCLADLANSGTLTGLTQAIADALVVGSLELIQTAPTQLIALDDAQYTGVYSGGFAPLVWGWCWRHQRRGAADEDLCGAVICTHKATVTSGSSRTLQYRESVLTIGWIGSTPTASIAATAEGYFPQLYGVAFYKATQTAITTLAHHSWLVEPPSPDSTLGIMASWYKPDGDVGRGRVDGRYGYEFSDTWPGSTTPFCAASGQSNSIFTTHIWQYTTSYAKGMVGNFSVGDGNGTSTGGEESWTLVDDRITPIHLSGSGGGVSSSVSSVPEQKIIFSESPGVAWIHGQAGGLSSETTRNLPFTELDRDPDACFSGAEFCLSYSFAAYIDTSTDDTDTRINSVLAIADETSWQWDDGSGEYALVKAVLDAAGTGYLATGAAGLRSFLGYSGLANMDAGDLPAGLDPIGAALPGTWVGAA